MGQQSNENLQLTLGREDLVSPSTGLSKSESGIILTRNTGNDQGDKFYMSLFSKIRHGLKDHIYEGRMKGLGSELDTYICLHLFAEFDTGVVHKMSAPFLARFMGCKSDAVQRSLRRLHEKGFIKRFHFRGKKTFYPILIHKFETPKGIFLNAEKTLNLNEIHFSVKVKCILKSTHRELMCNLNETYVLPIQELKNIEVKEIKKEKKKELTPLSSVSGKVKFLDYVYLTQAEYDRFCKEYGEKFTDKCIWKLDNTIPNSDKAKKYTDHNRAIRNWVVDVIHKEFPNLMKTGEQKPKPKEEDLMDTKDMKKFMETVTPKIGRAVK